MDRELRWRYLVLSVAAALFGLLIIVQAARLQFGENRQDFIDISKVFEDAILDSKPPRGQIYDRWGNLLAGNKTVYEVGVELITVKDAYALTTAVTSLLPELDYETVLNAVSQDYIPLESVYVTLSQGVSADTVTLFAEHMQRFEDGETDGKHDITGLVFFPSLQRSYPERDLAANLLGFVGQNEFQTGYIGYHGIEAYYNESLTGISENIKVPNNPNKAAELPDIFVPSSYVLTIDREIQAMVETLLDEAVDTYEAKSGTVIIMDPNTGEILAMATSRRIDLNNFSELYKEEFPPLTEKEVELGKQPFSYNAAINQTYEPGSVFKVLTMAIGLDSDKIDVDSTFFDPGFYEYGGITVRNWDNSGWGEQTMTGCMSHSLNVCFAWIADEIRPSIYYDYLEKFGFGHVTEIDLAGEVTGRLKIPGDGDWYDSDLVTNSFGQGIAVTPIQMVMAVSALANEGVMVVPRLVKASIHDGVQYEYAVRIAGHPISAQTAAEITEMLAVSLEGEASVALVYGYRLAGKTGTAEIPTKQGYALDITNTSFVGWGPVDDPQFIVYVWLEEPQNSMDGPTETIWGSSTAAPLFSDIVERLVVLLNLPPDDVRLSMAQP